MRQILVLCIKEPFPSLAPLILEQAGALWEIQVFSHHPCCGHYIPARVLTIMESSGHRSPGHWGQFLSTRDLGTLATCYFSQNFMIFYLISSIQTISLKP